MLFHTFKFFVFFWVVFGVYWSLRQHRARLAWLLIASFFFYMNWNPWLISLILFSASIDFYMALQLERVQSTVARRRLLILSISTNLSLLAFFKYVNFFLDSVHGCAGWFGWHYTSPALELILPLGISFYTFETISYIVDVYRGRCKAERSLLDYALYIMFFPHLIAGPIVRPRDFLPQLKLRKRFSWGRFYAGVRLFLLGLFKKAVLADQLARIVEPVFKEPAAFGSAAVWLAVLCYAMQIYCDFSGYSDMARGIAHTFGYKLPANFNLPYLAGNITQFWQRWHISLSSWLRDYLYIPLGGNRNGTAQTYRNLILTMLLGGLWHGASWTFVAWGLYHGVLLALHRACPWPRWTGQAIFRPFAVAGTFLLVCVGWVFFRAQTFADAAVVLGRMVQPVAGSSLAPPLAIAGLVCLAILLLGHLAARFIDWSRLEARLSASVVGVSLAGLFLLVQLLMPSTGALFIYFQF